MVGSTYSFARSTWGKKDLGPTNRFFREQTSTQTTYNFFQGRHLGYQAPTIC